MLSVVNLDTSQETTIHNRSLSCRVFLNDIVSWTLWCGILMQWSLLEWENYMIENDIGIKYYHKVTPVVAGKMKILTNFWHIACLSIMEEF